MKQSVIQFNVDLDEKNIPQHITWEASEKPGGISETKSISISVWDHIQKNTLRIDLWTKDMTIDEMKRFYIDCLGGLAQSMLNATGDEYMASATNELCEQLATHLKKEKK